MAGSLVAWIALYISLKGETDEDSSAIAFPLSVRELEIILMDAVRKERGGSNEGKTPISEEYLMRPTPMS